MAAICELKWLQLQALSRIASSSIAYREKHLAKAGWFQQKCFTREGGKAVK